MGNELNFLPRRQSELAHYAARLLVAVPTHNLDPAMLGWTDNDLAELDGLVADNQAALDNVNSLKLQLRGCTKTLSGRKGTQPRLAAKVRRLANTARVSSASTATLALIGVKRMPGHRSPRRAPSDAPQLGLRSVNLGWLQLIFRTLGSARPRARAQNAIGVQIAIVDAANPVVSGEADAARNLFAPHSPVVLATTKMPRRVRLYARWLTRRGETSPWSLPLITSVI